MTSDQSSTDPTQSRVIAYIDGFNLYYGVKNASRMADRLHLENGGDELDCLGRSLYWLDIERVVLGQLRSSEHCVSIKYFSAPRRVPKLVRCDDHDSLVESNDRQRVFLDAISTRPLVQIILGWYSENSPRTCPKCGHQWPAFEEKMTDVNIATHMLRDAYENKLDMALVMSADADLVPPVEALRAIGIPVLLVLPPGRKRAKHLRQVASITRVLKIADIRDYELPDSVTRTGLQPLVRPPHWARPKGWVWSDSPPTPSTE